jgi:phosphatidylglycerol:prolipoprotein diacylglycerol transferase
LDFTPSSAADGSASGLFLLGYGVCRFVVEYAREPDNFLGFLALGLTMGQWLSLPMILAGAIMMIWLPPRRQSAAYAARSTEVAARAAPAEGRGSERSRVDAGGRPNWRNE